MKIYTCKNVGVSGTTPCHIQEKDGVFEARIGISFLGSTNMDEEGFKACRYNPFHKKFYDNYASGKGATEEDAIKAMKKDMSDLCDTLWAV